MVVACGAVPARQGHRPRAGAGVACRMDRRARRRRRTVRDALLLDAGDGGAAVPGRAHRGAGAVMWSRAGAGLVAGFFLAAALVGLVGWRSAEHTSELQSLMRISYAVFGLK